MFSIAFLIGLYAYGIFILGLLQLLTGSFIFGYSFLFLLLCFTCWKYFDENISRKSIQKEIVGLFHTQKIVCILLLGGFVVIGMGILLPETSFDALWYHLPIPKQYIENQGIFYIPGSLFYYSTLPKLGELLYIIPLFFSSTIGTKLIHAFFAILTGIVIYLITKKQTNSRLSMLAVLIYFTNIVVLWEATTSYIDLARGFFETMSLYGLILYSQTNEKKYIYESALSLGLAVQTKLLSVVSLPALLFLLWKVKKQLSVLEIVCFIGLSTLLSIPWFIFSYLSTGNPIYPLFSGYPLENAWSISELIVSVPKLFLFADDPLSPMYVLLMPVVVFGWKRFTALQKGLIYTAILGLLGWVILPQTGGGRFIIGYLPLFSIIGAIAMFHLRKNVHLFRLAVISLYAVSILAIGYRFVAQSDGIPYLIGKESKTQYLSKKLNFSYGDFADTDGYFSRKITQNDKVLLIGFHNLFYVHFPYIHEDTARTGDRYNYIAVQNMELPDTYKNFEKIYVNQTTHVSLYQSTQSEWNAYDK